MFLVLSTYYRSTLSYTVVGKWWLMAANAFTSVMAALNTARSTIKFEQDL